MESKNMDRSVTMRPGASRSGHTMSSRKEKQSITIHLHNEDTNSQQQTQREWLNHSPNLLNAVGVQSRYESNQNLSNQVLQLASSEYNAGQMPALSFVQLIFSLKLRLFASRLVNQTKSRMFKNLTPLQYKLIGDKSYVYSPYQITQTAPAEHGGMALFGAAKRRFSIAKPLLNSPNRLHEDEDLELNNTNSSCTILTTLVSRLSKRLLEILEQRVPLFMPSSVFKIIWDLFGICLLAFLLIEIPLYATFYDAFHDNVTMFTIVCTTPILLVLDMLININSSFYEKGGLITSRGRILSNYYSKTLISEAMIILAFAEWDVWLIEQVYFPGMLGMNLHQFRCEKEDFQINTIFTWIPLIQLGTHHYGFEQQCACMDTLLAAYLPHQNEITDLIKLLWVILIINHYISCVWVLTNQIETSFGADRTWINSPGIYNADIWYFQYIEAFYFSMVTMVTVGYGDVLPITPFEKLTCVTIMVVSCGIFAYSMNTIGNILNNLNQDEEAIQRKMQIINTYMSKKNVNSDMQYSIREYLDYYWREARERDQDAENKIIHQLSDQLRENLLIEANKIVFKNSSIFRRNFSTRIKQRLIPLIKEYRCTPEEVICNEGDFDDASIFFIEKGTVSLYNEGSANQKTNCKHFFRSQLVSYRDLPDAELEYKQLFTLTTGQSFGEISFFTGKPRCASVRSLEFTTLLMIKRQSFLDLLGEFPDDFEQFSMIKDNIGLNSNYQCINISCYSCGSSQHLINACKFIHHQCNMQKTILLHNKTVHQMRDSDFKRTRPRLQNLLAEGFQQHVSHCAIDNDQDNIEEPTIKTYVDSLKLVDNQLMQLSSNRRRQNSLAEGYEEDSKGGQMNSIVVNSLSSISPTRIPQLKYNDLDQPSFVLPLQQLEMRKSVGNVLDYVQSRAHSTLSQRDDQIDGDFLRPTKLLDGTQEGTLRQFHLSNSNSINTDMSRNPNSQDRQLCARLSQDELSAVQKVAPARYPNLKVHVQASNKQSVSATNHHQGIARQPSQQKDEKIEQQLRDLIALLKKNIDGDSDSVREESTTQSPNARIPHFNSAFTADRSNATNATRAVNRQSGQQYLYESIPGMDLLKNFEIYFPLNNLSHQLKILAQRSLKNQKKNNQLLVHPTLKNIHHKDSPIQQNREKRFVKNQTLIQQVAMKYKQEQEELESLQEIEVNKRTFHQEISRFKNIFDSQQLISEDQIQYSQRLLASHVLLKNLNDQSGNLASPGNQHQTQDSSQMNLTGDPLKQSRVKVAAAENKKEILLGQLMTQTQSRGDISPHSHITVTTLPTVRQALISESSLAIVNDEDSLQNQTCLHVSEFKASMNHFEDK